MWISKLELTCFKSYQHQIFEFPMPEAGQNIVLIGGMNGFGKTSILEALYLGLYGKDAIIHLARAGLKTDEKTGYPTFLERAFNGEAKRDQSDTMMVRIVINKTKTKATNICRKWFFKSNGNWSREEEVVVRDEIRGVPGSPRVDGQNSFHFPELLDEVFVPAHVAPFFFFDGEEVKKLADQSRVEQIKQGLEGLLGVVLLRSLMERLKTYENSKRQEIVSVDVQRFHQLARDLQDNEVKLETLKSGSRNNDSEKYRLRAEQQSLLERITSSGGGGGDIANLKELLEEREQNRSQIRETQKALEEVLAGRMPFQLISRKLISQYASQLQAEIKYFEWEAEKRSLEPRQNEFEVAFNAQNEPAVEPNLTAGQIKSIKARMASAWAALFYPPPDDCAKIILHSYMHDPQRPKALDFVQSLSLGRKEIQDLITTQRALDKRNTELSRKISHLDGIDRDGTLAAMKVELEAVTKLMDTLSDQSRDQDRSLVVLEAQVGNMRADYEREKSRLDDSSPARALLEKSERVRRVIDEVIPALFPLKVRSLSKAMTEYYKQLAHKHQVDRIEITDTGFTRVLSATGSEIEFDRSAGENQIFATALIAGLAKVSGVRAPMVVDTPLGRLDSKHRENILKFWTSDTNRQVILLSQDEEIDFHFFKHIKDNVAKTYLLHHEDVGEGIGRTTAKENQYFAKGRR
jgi:DNA sulfur modification protein DndD